MVAEELYQVLAREYVCALEHVCAHVVRSQAQSVCLFMSIIFSSLTRVRFVEQISLEVLFRNDG